MNYVMRPFTNYVYHFETENYKPLLREIKVSK